MYLSLLDENGMAKRTYPTKRAEVPVTQVQLHEVRDELKADIRSLEQNMDSKFHAMNAKFENIDSKLHEMNSKFENVDSKFHEVNAKLDKMDSKLHAFTRLMELQHAENRAALEGYHHVSQEVLGLRKRFDDFEAGS